MMVAVGAVGLLVGLGVEGERRRQRFRQEAIRHFMILAEGESARRSWTQLPGLFPERVTAIDAWISYHDRMGEKYDRASRFPWLSVAADPPEPRPSWVAPEADVPDIGSSQYEASGMGGYPNHPPRF
jgi:hypothetical protein